jgi:hypothetical protein
MIVHVYGKIVLIIITKHATKNKRKRKKHFKHTLAQHFESLTPEFSLETVICYLVAHLLCLKDTKLYPPPLKVEGNKKS